MNRIKEVREWIKMSQSELARKVDLTPQAISLYERGDREPTRETWEKMASVLRVPVGYLMGLREWTPPYLQGLVLSSDLDQSTRTALQAAEPILKKYGFHLDTSQVTEGYPISITNGKQSRELTERDLDRLKEVTDAAIQNWLASFGAPFNQ